MMEANLSPSKDLISDGFRVFVSSQKEGWTRREVDVKELRKCFFEVIKIKKGMKEITLLILMQRLKGHSWRRPRPGLYRQVQQGQRDRL